MTLLVVCTVLGLTVGPASATILKPRKVDWPAGGTDFWVNLSSTDMWSTIITGADIPQTCANHTSDRSCPYGDWQTLAQSYFTFWSHVQKKGELPGVFRMPGFNSFRELYPQTRSTSQQYSAAFTLATTQYSVIADSITETGRLWAWVVHAAWYTKGRPWRFWSHDEATYTVKAHQPIVHTRCVNNNLTVTDLSNRTIVFYDLTDLGTLKHSGDFPLSAQQNMMLESATDDHNAQLVGWTTVPQPSSGATTLAAIVDIPASAQVARGIYSCTVDARLATAITQNRKNNGKVTTSYLTLNSTRVPSSTEFTYGARNSWPVMSIGPSWAKYLNPQLEESNSTVFQNLTAAAGLHDMSSFPGPDTGYLIESVLAITIVNGLARRFYKNGIIGQLEGWDFDSKTPKYGSWCKQMMPLHGFMGNGGSVYTLDEHDRRNATKLTMTAKATGYAYSPKGFTTILSIAVLYIYSCIVLVHWVYMIWAKESSNSWHSSSEIAALAMNSRPTEALHNTGAGVETSRIFKQQVRIVGVGEQVELSFRHRSDQEPIVPNAWYS